MKQDRYLSVDALRGLAILGMALSGMVAWDGLPAWMYHAQSPPPSRAFNPMVFGITWVDLVFPFFLFSMGVAIPFALSRKAEEGESSGRVALGLAVRTFQLAVFALLVQHFRPSVLAKTPTDSTFFLSLLVFGLIGLVLFRWPPSASQPLRIGLSLVGWIGIVAVCYGRSFADGKPFMWERTDIILLVLANVALTGGLTWWLTRTRPFARLAIMAVVAIIVFTCTLPGLSKLIWDWQPKPLGYFYQFQFQKYLLIVLPGTFIGEILLKKSVDFPLARLDNWRLISLVFLGIGASVLACWGMLEREITWTSLGLIGIVAGMLALVHAGVHQVVTDEEKESSKGDKMTAKLRQILAWGGWFVVLGLLAEPVNGGIRKDSPTMSYYLLTVGLACLILCSLAVLIDSLKGDRWVQGLILTGANPILAYAVITNVVPSVSGLFDLESKVGTLVQTSFGGSPWAVTAWGGIKTLFVAGVCILATRKGIFFRA